MKQWKGMLCLLCAMVGIASMALLPILAGADATLTVAIRIAPSVLILDMPQGGEITVHAEIPYRLVDKSSVQLDNVSASAVFADNRGNLVAKFNEALIKADMQPGDVTLRLTGVTQEGIAFAGAHTVRTIYWSKPAR